MGLSGSGKRGENHRGTEAWSRAFEVRDFERAGYARQKPFPFASKMAYVGGLLWFN